MMMWIDDRELRLQRSLLSQRKPVLCVLGCRILRLGRLRGRNESGRAFQEPATSNRSFLHCAPLLSTGLGITVTYSPPRRGGECAPNNVVTVIANSST